VRLVLEGFAARCRARKTTRDLRDAESHGSLWKLRSSDLNAAWWERAVLVFVRGDEDQKRQCLGVAGCCELMFWVCGGVLISTAGGARCSGRALSTTYPAFKFVETARRNNWVHRSGEVIVLAAIEQNFVSSLPDTWLSRVLRDGSADLRSVRKRVDRDSVRLPKGITTLVESDIARR